MRDLTPTEKLFIDSNYDQFIPRVLAVKLNINVDLVRKYMNSKGYASLAQKPRAELSDKDKNYIRDNSAGMTVTQMKNAIGVKYVDMVRRFVYNENLPYIKERYSSSKKGNGVNRTAYSNPFRGKMVRPAAVYSNPDWQKHGEELLKD